MITTHIVKRRLASTCWEFMKAIAHPASLLNELEELKSNVTPYLFRGQPSKDYYLQPKAFREDGINILEENYPNLCTDEWLFNNDIKNMIMRESKNSLSLDNSYVMRLCKLTIYVMKYNYSLAQYVEKYKEFFDKQTQELYSNKPPSYWIKETTFQRGLRENLLAAMQCTDLQNNVITPAKLPSHLTAGDESLHQHYGIPTAALDWTSNPYKAVYFALQNIPKTLCFSLYAYKANDTNGTMPILIKNGHPGIKNPRLEAQEGAFICFIDAFSFHFYCGRWPCVEDYREYNSFELIKYDIPVRYTKYFNDLLIKKHITKESLLLDKDLDK